MFEVVAVLPLIAAPECLKTCVSTIVSLKN